MIGLALVATFALSAIAAASAFASPEFLVSGVAATAGTQLLSMGELLLTDTATGIELLCSGEDLAEILSATDLDILSIFPLGGTDPTLGGTTILCTVQKGSCSEPEAKAVNLNWLVTLLTLTTAELGPGEGGEPGWTVTCSKILSDTCTGKTQVEIANVESMVNTTFGTLSNLTPAHCTFSGANTGEVFGTVLNESLTAGLAVAVS